MKGAEVRFSDLVGPSLRRWSDLSERTRGLLIAGAAAEARLKAAALVDIVRRPANEVRGSKLLWGVLVTVVNSCGGAPLAYFAFGRRQRRR